MRIIVSGGGTGGHVFPAVAVLEKLKQQDPELELLYLGNPGSLEEKTIRSKNWSFRSLRVSPLNGENILGKMKAALHMVTGTLRALRIMRRFAPQAVLCTGGYVTGPVLLAAKLLKIPYYLHEQNVFPGLANRSFEKNARKVFISFPESRRHFRLPEDQVILTGNPVRRIFFDMDREKVRQELHLDHQKLIFSLGGSGGSRKLNEFVLGAESLLRNFPQWRWIHVSGRDYGEEYQQRYEEQGLIEAHLYLEDLPPYMGAADLVIARSGALTLSEISALGVASVLVPSPNVANDHQRFNARFFEDAGAAVVLDDEQLTDDSTYQLIAELMQDDSKRARMAARAKELALPDAAQRIAQAILQQEETA